MNEMPLQPEWQTIGIPIGQFAARMTDLTRVTAGLEQPSMHSRLALIHQTAKVYAIEAAHQAGCPMPIVTIDELTNPPLIDLPVDPDDEQQVVIRFSYQPDPLH